jgi:hypothetical protein
MKDALNFGFRSADWEEERQKIRSIVRWAKQNKTTGQERIERPGFPPARE